ncbi:MAG: hypothetical protein JST89_01940 [Cyanobacteria bacterium SZAS-4]|nr:hypothetical protein [Cyanobacteria bacterium SZAS-4]
MTLNFKLEQMCLSAYESWLIGEKSGEHGISVFTELEAGTQTTKRIFCQSRKDSVASARELAYTEAQRGLDAIVVYAEIVIGNESVLFEVIERNQETLQRYKVSGNAASDCFELTFIESISIKVFRHALWEAKCFGLSLYTRRAKKIQSNEFLNYCQSISKYTTSGELQNAVYLNRDTDISFALQLVPYNEAGECCVTFEIETFKANILALEATKELVAFALNLISILIHIHSLRIGLSATFLRHDVFKKCLEMSIVSMPCLKRRLSSFGRGIFASLLNCRASN